MAARFREREKEKEKIQNTKPLRLNAKTLYEIEMFRSVQLMILASIVRFGYPCEVNRMGVLINLPKFKWMTEY